MSVIVASRVTARRRPLDVIMLGMGRETRIDHEAAARISAAAERDPQGPTATSGFDDRAQAAAGRNELEDDDC